MRKVLRCDFFILFINACIDKPKVPVGSLFICHFLLVYIYIYIYIYNTKHAEQCQILVNYIGEILSNITQKTLIEYNILKINELKHLVLISTMICWCERGPVFFKLYYHSHCIRRCFPRYFPCSSLVFMYFVTIDVCCISCSFHSSFYMPCAYG